MRRRKNMSTFNFSLLDFEQNQPTAHVIFTRMRIATQNFPTERYVKFHIILKITTFKRQRCQIFQNPYILAKVMKDASVLVA